MATDYFSLAGKTAIVTGAGSGIGRAISQAFAQSGASVICADIDGETASATASSIREAGGRAEGETCDVSRAEDAERAVAAALRAFGGVGILVNGAAALDPRGSVLELDEDDWNRVFAVNVTGAFLMSKAALPRIIEGGGGSIIHIASQLGRVGAARRAVYCATKGALIQLAKAMALDHAGDNVRVNTLSPGAVKTERLVRRLGSAEAAAEANQASARKHPVGRIAQPEEIARAAVFLASDASQFMTGADLLIDGGYTAI